MKALWITLAVLFVLVLLCCGGIFWFGRGAISQALEINKDASTYARQSLTAIGSSWDVKELKKRATPEMQSDTARMTAITDLGKNSLGKLVSLDEFKLRDLSTSAETGKESTVKVTLTGSGKFEKAPADIEMVVEKRGEKWSVADIRLTPNASR